MQTAHISNGGDRSWRAAILQTANNCERQIYSRDNSYEVVRVYCLRDQHARVPTYYPRKRVVVSQRTSGIDVNFSLKVATANRLIVHDKVASSPRGFENIITSHVSRQRDIYGLR